MSDMAVRRPAPTWLTVTISVAFGLFYAYAVWNAVAFLITQATSAFGLNGVGWAFLIFAAAFPLIVFAAAFAIGWRLRPLLPVCRCTSTRGRLRSGWTWLLCWLLLLLVRISTSAGRKG